LYALRVWRLRWTGFSLSAWKSRPPEPPVLLLSLLVRLPLSLWRTWDRMLECGQRCSTMLIGEFAFASKQGLDEALGCGRFR
jgi:hypothetical protein